MDSMLVSGKEALQANSDRHFTASWKESMEAGKYLSNTFAGKSQNKSTKLIYCHLLHFSSLIYFSPESFRETPSNLYYMVS